MKTFFRNWKAIYIWYYLLLILPSSFHSSRNILYNLCKTHTRNSCSLRKKIAICCWRRNNYNVIICYTRRHNYLKVVLLFIASEFYERTDKRSAIIRNNRNYLLDNIQADDRLIASLLSINCITEEQGNVIQRQRLSRDKNAELLFVVHSFDQTNYSKFVRCLRRNNQMTMARIIENGGGKFQTLLFIKMA